MMKMNNNTSQDNGFMSGFILGVIVGAVGIFLLGTKRGKKLLKILSEEGIEGMSELEELLTEKILDEKPVVEKKKVVKKPIVEQVVEVPADEVVQENISEQKEEVKKVEEQEQNASEEPKSYLPHALGRMHTSGRRFFKGIRKKTS